MPTFGLESWFYLEKEEKQEIKEIIQEEKEKDDGSTITIKPDESKKSEEENWDKVLERKIPGYKTKCTYILRVLSESFLVGLVIGGLMKIAKIGYLMIKSK